MIMLINTRLELKKGDIFFTRGAGLISRLIRIFSRTGGESRTYVNHVGIIVDDEGTAVEALNGVKRHDLYTQYDDGKTSIAVYRPRDLTPEELDAIVARAESYVGKKYGYAKIFAHLGDWILGGRYFFRRFALMDEYPICSWLVAAAYAAADKNFGCEIGQAEPDDIWDFVNSNFEKYGCVWPL